MKLTYQQREEIKATLTEKIQGAIDIIRSEDDFRVSAELQLEAMKVLFLFLKEDREE